MTNEEFIRKNREADIRSLALKRVPEGVDALWCMRQIEGYQLARKKLPRWADTDGIWYPPRISMEQCSSEATAQYKASIIDRLLGTSRHAMADLTGGFGVDFSYMAQGFTHATYVEQQEVLCQSAVHNMPLLGLPNAHIVNEDTTQYVSTLQASTTHFDLLFIDPARRDNAGRKTVAIEDCTPDITTLQDTLLPHSTIIIIKLSPMLDITQALRTLHHVAEVHVISVRGECKELLFVLSSQHTTAITTYCANLGTQEETLVTTGTTPHDVPLADAQPGMYLFEPNASIMKAGRQNDFAHHYALHKLHPMSNLFVAKDATQIHTSIPARTFRIIDIYDFSKPEIKRLRTTMTQANITVRNFPASVDDIRKRLKLKEGGKDYLFVTTLHGNDRHVIIHCIK